MFELHCFKETEEAELSLRFIHWQGYTGTRLKLVAASLKETGGTVTPVLKFRDKSKGDTEHKTVAVGFFKIVDWFRGQGLIRC